MFNNYVVIAAHTTNIPSYVEYKHNYKIYIIFLCFYMMVTNNGVIKSNKNLF